MSANVAPPPRYRIILINARTGRRRATGRPLDLYAAARACAFYELRGKRQGRPVIAEIVTVVA